MSVRDTGILRKRTHAHSGVLKQPQTSTDDLLIIGYQSHLFRDDEKAQLIDQGTHLIGWMGEESLKIDRYDVRATLSDLAPYEAPPGGYSNRLDYLSPAEQKAEQLCEEERYYSLYTNEIEEEAYQEELLKRQQPGYGQIGFNYEGGASGEQSQTPHGPEEASAEEDQEPDDPFEPLPNFEIPIYIELPETMRLNAIIEKTARFIAAQGVQMEILIKAKQSNNPQFDFLNMNGHCNAYYKFIVAAIKDGRYPDRAPPAPPEQQQPPTKENGENSRDSEKKRKVKEDSTNGEIRAPVLAKFVPSEDCAYSQLISKIQGKPISEIKPSTPTPPPESTGEGLSKEKLLPPRPTVDFKNKSNSVEVKKISTGLMLAQSYLSDTEGDSDGDGEEKPAEISPSKLPESINLTKLDLPVPPDDLRTIIDKTAAYVAKNGKDFEDILRTKKDSRFAFLDEASEYHRYYIYKVTGTIYIPAETTNTTQIATTSSKSTNGSGTHEATKANIVQPVSFTIRPPPAQQRREENTSEVLQRATEVKLNDSGEDTDDDESLSVAELLEREERKEIRRVEERVRDKLAAAAREKLGLISKEKQLQLERKKKAMAFLQQIKKNDNGTASPPVTGNSSNGGSEAKETKGEEKREAVDRSSRRSSRSRSPMVQIRRERRRSRSRSRSRSRNTKSKRKKRSRDREKRQERSSSRKKSKHNRRRSRSSSASSSSSRDRGHRRRSRSRSRSRRSGERSRHR